MDTGTARLWIMTLEFRDCCVAVSFFPCTELCMHCMLCRCHMSGSTSRCFVQVDQASKRYLQTDKRSAYTTPKTFLELIKLYKNILAKNRERILSGIDRLQNGLDKLEQTQKDVDILVEQAKVKAVEVEEKVVAADAFAEKVPSPLLPVTPHTSNLYCNEFGSRRVGGQRSPLATPLDVSTRRLASITA